MLLNCIHKVIAVMCTLYSITTDTVKLGKVMSQIGVKCHSIREPIMRFFWWYWRITSTAAATMTT